MKRILITLIFCICGIQIITATQVKKRKQCTLAIDISELFKDSLFQDESLPREQRKNLESKFNQLKNLSDINTINQEGSTPLMLAARGFETTIFGANQENVTTTTDTVPQAWLDYIFSKHPDINKQNNEGKTALHIAVQQRNEQLVQRLLDAGADATIRDNDNKRAINYTEITEYDTPHEQAEKNSLKKLLKAHAQQLRKETADAFAQLYQQEQINVPTGVVSSIASYIAPKPSQ